MQARIVVYRNGKQELCVPVAESGSGIGRDAGNPVQLSMPEVSKQHAFLKHTPKGWYVRDLDSRNGLYVNGIRTREAILQDGDQMKVGPYTLVFEIADAAAPYKPLIQIDFSDDASLQTMQAPRAGN